MFRFLEVVVFWTLLYAGGLAAGRPIGLLKSILPDEHATQTAEHVALLLETMLSNDLATCSPLLAHDGTLPAPIQHRLLTSRSADLRPITVLPVPPQTSQYEEIRLNTNENLSPRPDGKGIKRKTRKESTSIEMAGPNLPILRKCEKKKPEQKPRQPCNAYIIVSQLSNLEKMVAFVFAGGDGAVPIRLDRDHFIFYTWDAPLRARYQWFERSFGVTHSIAINPIQSGNLFLERFCLWCDKGKAALLHMDTFTPGKGFACNSYLFPDLTKNLHGATVKAYRSNPFPLSFMFQQRNKPIDPRRDPDFQLRALELASTMFNFDLSVELAPSADLPKLLESQKERGDGKWETALALGPPPLRSMATGPISSSKYEMPDLPSHCLYNPFSDPTAWVALLLPLASFSFTFHLLSRLTQRPTQHSSIQVAYMALFCRKRQSTPTPPPPPTETEQPIKRAPRIFSMLYLILCILATLYYMNKMVECITSHQVEEDIDQLDQVEQSEYIVALPYQPPDEKAIEFQPTDLQPNHLSPQAAFACLQMALSQGRPCPHIQQNMLDIAVNNSLQATTNPWLKRSQSTPMTWALQSRSPLKSNLENLLTRLAETGHLQKWKKEMKLEMEQADKRRVAAQEEFTRKSGALSRVFTGNVIEKGADLVRAASFVLPMGLLFIVLLLTLERCTAFCAYGGLRAVWCRLSELRILRSEKYRFDEEDDDDDDDDDDEKHPLLDDSDEVKTPLITDEESDNDAHFSQNVSSATEDTVNEKQEDKLVLI